MRLKFSGIAAPRPSTGALTASFLFGPAPDCCFAALDPMWGSASPVTAGALGFLTFTQYLDRPERYGEPSCFDTMPSQPNRPTSRKIIAPSSS